MVPMIRSLHTWGNTWEALDDSWEETTKIWENKQNFLPQDLMKVTQKESNLEPHSHQEPSVLNVGEQDLMEVLKGNLIWNLILTRSHLY